MPTRAERAREAASLAEVNLTCCQLCPRNCRVNRRAGERGYCGLDDKAHCFREMLQWAEETVLIPSHHIYFAGCNLHCDFCTVAEWNEQPLNVKALDEDWLLDRIEQRQRQGARNVNLLGGEPSVSLPGILRLLSRLRIPARVVWNSNMYYNECVGDLLHGLIDICLADLKCGNSRCAEALLGAGDYLDVVRRNIRLAAEHTDLIVRHVILPGHAECCLEPTLKWLAAEVPGARLSLRGDYIPPARAVAAPKDYMTDHEIRRAVDRARELGLNVIQ
ncbi:MAG TPA: radical SAM protein [Sedimentisphaerales bacterium]|nr:radical SAM protein [Sedimentisphaerales bacterium]HRS12826.1 radical SAM protein [Sedimentisphaerales bacterium]HRV49449.1 radical SAM protein [Sedimentisphaerales bacterium]